MKILKTVRIARRHEDVFRAISLGEFFRSSGIIQSSLSLDFKEKGAFSFACPWGHKCSGIFLSIGFASFISFSWVKSGAEHSEKSLVSLVQIRLAPDGNDTVLELAHSGLNISDALDFYHLEWASVLETFKKNLENYGLNDRARNLSYV